MKNQLICSCHLSLCILLAGGCSQSFKTVNAVELSNEVGSGDNHEVVWLYLGKNEYYHYLRKQCLVVIPSPFHKCREYFRVPLSQLRVDESISYQAGDTSQAKIIFRQKNPHPPPKYISEFLGKDEVHVLR